jgi:glutathione synthase/RimK-type ligase-like ATP-grasp enzyme
MGPLMTVVILTDAGDDEAARIKKKLEDRGVEAHYFDTSCFPQTVSISWTPQERVGSLRLEDGRQLNFDEIRSVYWRIMCEVHVAPQLSPEMQRVARYDSFSLLRTFFRGCPARWVNGWEAMEFHKEKPLQLAKAQELGVRIPRTLISNSAEEILAFIGDGQEYIFKPVYGGARTKKLNTVEMNQERLQRVLSLSPVTIQTYIPGTNIRSFIVGERVFTLEFISKRVDFRDDHELAVVPWTLPRPQVERALAIGQAFGLSWGAIDWRLDERGDYYFLEANPSPMFVYAEDKSGLPISDALVDLLL